MTLFLKRIRPSAAVVALLLMTGCAGSALQPSTGQYVDDRVITAKVKTKLLKSSQTRGLAIDVDTFKGRVLLGGFVDSEEERVSAIDLARSVAGVVAVDSAMRLKSEEISEARVTR